MSCFVYVLKNQVSGKRYVGMSDNPEKRLIAHNSGQTKSTKNRGTWVIVHTEEFPDRITAFTREKFLKSGQGRALLDKLGL